jgi:hypothetical protein
LMTKRLSSIWQSVTNRLLEGLRGHLAESDRWYEKYEPSEWEGRGPRWRLEEG